MQLYATPILLLYQFHLAVVLVYLLNLTFWCWGYLSISMHMFKYASVVHFLVELSWSSVILLDVFFEVILLDVFYGHLFHAFVRIIMLFVTGNCLCSIYVWELLVIFQGGGFQKAKTGSTFRSGSSNHVWPTDGRLWSSAQKKVQRCTLLHSLSHLVKFC